MIIAHVPARLFYRNTDIQNIVRQSYNKQYRRRVRQDVLTMILAPLYYNEHYSVYIVRHAFAHVSDTVSVDQWLIRQNTLVTDDVLEMLQLHIESKGCANER